MIEKKENWGSYQFGVKGLETDIEYEIRVACIM